MDVIINSCKLVNLELEKVSFFYQREELDES